MNPEDKYEIQFSGLANGLHHFDWVLKDSFFKSHECDEITSASLNANVDVNKTDRMMTLSFFIKGQAKCICDHCGDDVWLPIDVSQEIIARFSDETDFTGDEVIFLGQGEYKIDVSQILYEFCLLALPTKKIHVEGECNPDVEQYLLTEEQVKKEKTNDPRWNALEQLKKQV